MKPEDLFHKHGAPNPDPQIGQTVLLEGGGMLDQAAFTVGEITTGYVGGPRKRRYLVIKEKQVFFANGEIAHPRREPVAVLHNHFARSIQERLRARAAELVKVAGQYQSWAEK